MSCNGGAPPMNTDISGIGVRVSFYLQNLLLGCLSARSASYDEVSGSLYTLLATNTGTAVTALILGLKPTPEISFQDALIVFYLLHLSGITVFLSLPGEEKIELEKKYANGARDRVSLSIKMLHICSIIQTYTIFAFAFAVLWTADTFGSNSDCNTNAVVVILHSFPAIKAGQIVLSVISGLCAILYTVILIEDHLPPGPKKWIRQRISRRIPVVAAQQDMTSEDDTAGTERMSPPANTRKIFEYKDHPTRPQAAAKATEPKLWIDWPLVIRITFVLVAWGLVVLNTELLIRWNNFAPSNQSAWQFGQILALFLVVVPLASVISVFWMLGLRPSSPRHQ
ncbi:hypothetical protein MVEN_00887100 [Mycena venus]|uniref:Uncharacterized protein n=1 Tax=Mycena venus TaxID=2733690 RepID=A0A8H6YHH0_9AGAR|nr:hypothetical protein MVEN_00887100 [Mycena venus]